MQDFVDNFILKDNKMIIAFSGLYVCVFIQTELIIRNILDNAKIPYDFGASVVGGGLLIDATILLSLIQYLLLVYSVFLIQKKYAESIMKQFSK